MALMRSTFWKLCTYPRTNVFKSHKLNGRRKCNRQQNEKNTNTYVTDISNKSLGVQKIVKIRNPNDLKKINSIKLLKRKELQKKKRDILSMKYAATKLTGMIFSPVKLKSDISKSDSLINLAQHLINFSSAKQITKSKKNVQLSAEKINVSQKHISIVLSVFTNKVYLMTYFNNVNKKVSNKNYVFRSPKNNNLNSMNLLGNLGQVRFRRSSLLKGMEENHALSFLTLNRHHHKTTFNMNDNKRSQHNSTEDNKLTGGNEVNLPNSNKDNLEMLSIQKQNGTNLYKIESNNDKGNERSNTFKKKTGNINITYSCTEQNEYVRNISKLTETNVFPDSVVMLVRKKKHSSEDYFKNIIKNNNMTFKTVKKVDELLNSKQDKKLAIETPFIRKNYEMKKLLKIYNNSDSLLRNDLTEYPFARLDSEKSAMLLLRNRLRRSEKSLNYKTRNFRNKQSNWILDNLLMNSTDVYSNIPKKDVSSRRSRAYTAGPEQTQIDHIKNSGFQQENKEYIERPMKHVKTNKQNTPETSMLFQNLTQVENDDKKRSTEKKQKMDYTEYSAARLCSDRNKILSLKNRVQRDDEAFDHDTHNIIRNRQISCISDDILTNPQDKNKSVPKKDFGTFRFKASTSGYKINQDIKSSSKEHLNRSLKDKINTQRSITTPDHTTHDFIRNRQSNWMSNDLLTNLPSEYKISPTMDARKCQSKIFILEPELTQTKDIKSCESKVQNKEHSKRNEKDKMDIEKNIAPQDHPPTHDFNGNRQVSWISDDNLTNSPNVCGSSWKKDVSSCQSKVLISGSEQIKTKGIKNVDFKEQNKDPFKRSEKDKIDITRSTAPQDDNTHDFIRNSQISWISVDHLANSPDRYRSIPKKSVSSSRSKTLISRSEQIQTKGIKSCESKEQSKEPMKRSKDKTFEHVILDIINTPPEPFVQFRNVAEVDGILENNDKKPLTGKVDTVNKYKIEAPSVIQGPIYILSLEIQNEKIARDLKRNKSLYNFKKFIEKLFKIEPVEIQYKNRLSVKNEHMSDGETKRMNESSLYKQLNENGTSQSPKKIAYLHTYEVSKDSDFETNTFCKTPSNETNFECVHDYKPFKISRLNENDQNERYSVILDYGNIETYRNSGNQPPDDDHKINNSLSINKSNKVKCIIRKEQPSSNLSHTFKVKNKMKNHQSVYQISRHTPIKIDMLTPRFKINKYKKPSANKSDCSDQTQHNLYKETEEMYKCIMKTNNENKVINYKHSTGETDKLTNSPGIIVKDNSHNNFSTKLKQTNKLDKTQNADSSESSFQSNNKTNSEESKTYLQQFNEFYYKIAQANSRIFHGFIKNPKNKSKTGGKF